MVTYDELFTFVTMLCAVITLVVYIQRKKQRPRPGKIRRYFCKLLLPAARCTLAFGSLVKYIICQVHQFVKQKPAPCANRKSARICHNTKKPRNYGLFPHSCEVFKEVEQTGFEPVSKNQFPVLLLSQSVLCHSLRRPEADILTASVAS